jgi:acetylornithine deacetylase
VVKGRTFTPVEMLERLVAFDTTSSLSNLPLIDFVREYLEDHGIASRLTRDDAGGKANLWATLGPEDRAGVILSGHTDVVPVEGQPWSSDPFALTPRGDRLYGRGTADMKGFIAVVLAELPEFLARRAHRPVHLAFSYDEEVGCLGVGRLIADLPEDRPRPELVVVGEPTELRVVHTHKGIRGFETRVTGWAAHSSAPHLGASAILGALRVIGFLEEVGEQKRDAPPDSAFEPPHTTLNVGTIEGGTALNIIPRECRFCWEYRPLPAEDPDEIPDRVRAFVAAEFGEGPTAVQTRELLNVPALVPAAADSPAVAFARQILGSAEPPGGVSFVTEGGLFQQAGIPAVVCGPGSVAQAHQADEFVTLEQLERATRFVRQIYARVADGAPA